VEDEWSWNLVRRRVWSSWEIEIVNELWDVIGAKKPTRGASGWLIVGRI